MCVFCCRPPHSENGVCGPTRAGAISDDAGLSETANPSRAWPFDWKSEDLVPRSSCRFHCAHWGECFVFVACLRRSPESVQVGMTAITATGVYWHGVWIATPPTSSIPQSRKFRHALMPAAVSVVLVMMVVTAVSVVSPSHN
jgi:hypothetical protein